MHEAAPISAERIDDEVMFRVPRPNTIHIPDEVEFLNVAGRKLALVVVPPLSRYPVQPGEGVKVIAGRGPSIVFL